MTTDRHARFMALLLGTASACAVLSAPAVSAAQENQLQRFSIPSQDAAQALNEYARQAGVQIVFPFDRVRGRQTPSVEGDLTRQEALAMLTDGLGLSITSNRAGMVTLADDADPQSGSAAGDGAGTVEALIVTAQKREEDIQDVPIAISAFSQETLERSQVAGGPDLMTQVPNMTFTKTNFTSYSIQIRGIGTQAISATTDPAVAVAFNNTPFVRNRFFEQEFYDLQRVEVLRGPQGTLYGRNATAGVVNIISAKPSFNYEAKVSGDLANYNSTRIEGMINLPLVEDTVALRIAGAWTKRDGFVTNELTGNPIDGRDLWSTRVSLRLAPTDWLDVNLIYEHFEEDDDRLRAGKQLCKRHVITEVGGIPVNFLDPVPDYGQTGNVTTNVQSAFSQGCLPSSLYSPDTFQVPNGFSLPYATLGSGARDPYASATQSRDLRVIESAVDPDYRAKADLVELQFTADLSDTLSLTSETAWLHDFVYGLQDLNRFNTLPGEFNGLTGELGNFCDPQIGCSDRLVAMDLATAKSDHFSQEFRLGSNFDGAFNFSLGANFLRYDTEDKYYVFANKLTSSAASNSNMTPYVPGVSDNRDCMQGGPRPPDFGTIYQVFNCTYIDPNPFGSLNDRGHNYFLSKNPFKLISYAVFGEAYYNVTEALKITAGLRWTVDKKEAPRIPTWVLGSETVGFSVLEVVEQEWREPTGRLTIDWKPDLAFTDETLLYASYAHGYKAGGANPPPYGIIMFCAGCGGTARIVEGVLENSRTQPKTFEPEFIDAFEVGAKNTLFDGRVTLNLAAFYYDYEGYQISQIVNRSAVNLNFDAEVWGLEIEADWRPLENLRLGFKGGYENTKVADGMQAIDIMDRTAGREGWMIVKPFPTFPSNCILPTELYVPPGGSSFGPIIGLGGPNGGNPGGCELAYFMGVDPATELPYGEWDGTRAGAEGSAGFWSDEALSQYEGFDPSQPDINNGEGFFKDLSGNELPNAPNFTATITADYTVPLAADWLMTLHTDLYYQSEAWTRIFNTEGYDKLKAYSNINLAAIFANEEAGWRVMAYVKNVLDRDSITGAFLFSDDTGLTTNVFLTEPRLYGLRVTKEWNGGPWWTGANPNHTGPYPLTVEIGGQVQRQDAPYATLTPVAADSFTGPLDTAEAQNRDLDWGDGRELRLTYALSGDTWRIGAGYRIGKTNGTDQTLDFVLGDAGCAGAQYICDYYDNDPSFYFTGDNYSDVTVTNREEHRLVDFDIGRDLGIGAGLESAVRAGLRYAQLESTTHMLMFGVSDWYIPAEYALFSYSHNTHYKADLDASREFEGFGPTLSWDAAKRLWGSDQGHLDLEWSLTGGVLFGKQETAFEGTETSAYFSGKYFSSFDNQLKIQPRDGFVDITDLPAARSKSVTAPLVDLSAGLAYEAGRVKVGAGYRWERYFDVLDAGYDEAKDADRTIDGPYFKLSVGFGG